MWGRGGAEACWGPGKPAHLRFSLGQSSAPPGCPLVSVDVPSVARTKRSCNSSVVFPVHPATPREGCASLTPLTFTKKDTVVQTGTLPVSGHPGSQFCPPSSPLSEKCPYAGHPAASREPSSRPARPSRGHAPGTQPGPGWQAAMSPTPAQLTAPWGSSPATATAASQAGHGQSRVVVSGGPGECSAKDRVWAEIWKGELGLPGAVPGGGGGSC